MVARHGCCGCCVVVVCVVCCAVFSLELRYFLATLLYEPIRLWNDGLLLCSRTALSFGSSAKYESPAQSSRYDDWAGLSF